MYGIDMHTFIALSPVLLALSLMLFLRQPAARALAGSWLLAALLCLMVWRMDV